MCRECCVCSVCRDTECCSVCRVCCFIFTLATQYQTPSRRSSPVNDAASAEVDNHGNDDNFDDQVGPVPEGSELGVDEAVSLGLQSRIQSCRDALNENSTNLKACIRKENKECMTAHKMKNPTKATTEVCKTWLHLHILRLTKQLTVKFKTRLTARDRAMTIIRLLTILHHVRHCYEHHHVHSLINNAGSSFA